MNSSDQTWLAAYLFYAEFREVFLIKGVQFFACSVMEKNLAEQFFFIRFWERGPHIRLCFKSEKKHPESKVKQSQRDEPEQIKQLPEDQHWFPNNSVIFIPYEPEIERYGGPIGGVYEKQF